MMYDLLKKQFVFSGGVITVGFCDFDGKHTPTMNLALYGEVSVEADDAYVSTDMSPPCFRSLTIAIKEAQDYQESLGRILREASK